MKPYGLKHYSLLCLVSYALVGCSSLTFRPYAQSVLPVLQQLDNPAQLTPIEGSGLDKLNHGPNQLLYFLEKGRIAQIQGDFKSSLQSFSQAMERVDQQTSGPIIELSQLGQKGLSLAVNDKVRDYVMPPDQRSFLQAFQALNYLFLHRAEGAAVEARREGVLYQQAIDSHRAVGQAVEKQVNRLALDPKVVNKASQAHLNSLPSPKDLPQYSFLNAYSFFVSGLAFELNNQLNDAVIEYKKALAVDPQNRFIQQRLTRLIHSVRQSSSEVLILYEQGWVPSLRAENFPIAWGDHLEWMSLPTYGDPWLPASPFTVRSDENKAVVMSDSLVDVYGLAVQSLKERSAALMVRQLLRLAVKINLGAQARQQAGEIGLVLSDIYNAVSEQADVRSWLSLPRGVQLASIALKPGSHKLFWQDPQTGLSHTLNLEIVPHQTHLVRIVNTGHKLYVQAVAYKNPLL